jgi:hypothetical protein
LWHNVGGTIIDAHRQHEEVVVEDWGLSRGGVKAE